MSRYHIVCTDLKPVLSPRPHQHIVSVGVDTDNVDDYANEKHSLQTVIDNIREKNDTYFTIGNFTHRQVTVEVVRCPACGHLIIKTRPDNTRDNNLETMRTCQWRTS